MTGVRIDVVDIQAIGADVGIGHSSKLGDCRGDAGYRIWCKYRGWQYVME